MLIMTILNLSLKISQYQSLQKKAGLTAKEYERLMQTPFVDECVHLILKGIKNLSSKKGSLNDQA